MQTWRRGGFIRTLEFYEQNLYLAKQIQFCFVRAKEKPKVLPDLWLSKVVSIATTNERLSKQKNRGSLITGWKTENRSHLNYSTHNSTVFFANGRIVQFAGYLAQAWHLFNGDFEDMKLSAGISDQGRSISACCGDLKALLFPRRLRVSSLFFTSCLFSTGCGRATSGQEDALVKTRSSLPCPSKTAKKANRIRHSVPV